MLVGVIVVVVVGLVVAGVVMVGLIMVCVVLMADVAAVADVVGDVMCVVGLVVVW